MTIKVSIIIPGRFHQIVFRMELRWSLEDITTQFIIILLQPYAGLFKGCQTDYITDIHNMNDGILISVFNCTILFYATSSIMIIFRATSACDSTGTSV